MTVATGHKARLVAGKQSDYDTAIAVTDLLPLLSESASMEFIRVADEILCGNAGRLSDTVTGKVATAPITVQGVYDNVSSGDPFGIELLLLACLGTATRVSSDNRYTLTDILAEYLTIGINKQVSIFEYIGAKCDGMNFSIDQDALAVFTFDFACKNRFKTGDGSVTNSIAGANALNKASVTKMKWQDMVFRVANLDDIMTSSDQVTITSVSLNMIRNMKVDDRGTPISSGHTDSQLVQEPSEDGLRDVTLSFTTPRYEADTFIDFMEASSGQGTKLQADIKFTNSSETFNISIPNFKIIGTSESITDAGVLTQDVECICHLNNGDNTVMLYNDSATSVDEEFGIEVNSGRVATP